VSSSIRASVFAYMAVPARSAKLQKLDPVAEGIVQIGAPQARRSTSRRQATPARSRLAVMR